MKNTTYELGPRLAEIRDGFRGMRTSRGPIRAARRESTKAARAARKSGRTLTGAAMTDFSDDCATSCFKMK